MPMAIMIAFSIKVASVIGRFRILPKHAHRMDFLLIKVFVTPKVVMLNRISVMAVAVKTSNLYRSKRPRLVSINGYRNAYSLTRLASGSYMLKEVANPLISKILKKLKTIKKIPIKSSI